MEVRGAPPDRHMGYNARVGPRQEKRMRQYIRHPAGIPLEVKISDHPGPSEDRLNNVSIGGLSFRSQDRLRPGDRVTIRIPLLGGAGQLHGQVVWCNALCGAYEIGVTFLDTEEAFRTRMVEQICYIEQYRSQVLEREGRRLTSEEAAAEWITKFADSFPEMKQDQSS